MTEPWDDHREAPVDGDGHFTDRTPLTELMEAEEAEGSGGDAARERSRAFAAERAQFEGEWKRRGANALMASIVGPNRSLAGAFDDFCAALMFYPDLAGKLGIRSHADMGVQKGLIRATVMEQIDRYVARVSAGVRADKEKPLPPNARKLVTRLQCAKAQWQNVNRARGARRRRAAKVRSGENF